MNTALSVVGLACLATNPIRINLFYSYYISISRYVCQNNLLFTSI